jgi:hypothetical protein
MRGTSGARISRALVLLFASACGGKAIDVEPLLALAVPTPSALPSASAAATLPPVAEAAPDAADCGPLPANAVTVERGWEVGHSDYGFNGPGIFGVAPDGSEVVLAAGQYAPKVLHFRATDGFSSTDTLPGIWRDRSWTIQAEGYPFLGVLSLATGQPIAGLTVSDASVPSGDGKSIILASCPYNTVTFKSVAVPSGETAESPPVAGGCASTDLVASRSGDAVLFVPSGSGELHRVVLATGASTIVRAHLDGFYGDNVAIYLSSTEQSVATVGHDNVLRIWSYPALERVGVDIPTAWTREFMGCYCAPRQFAPVAWSSDDQLLAMSDADGNTVIRRACDGSLMTTLPAPTAALRSNFSGNGKWGPTFLAFGPHDASLAVFYEGSLSLYRLQR